MAEPLVCRPPRRNGLLALGLLALSAVSLGMGALGMLARRPPGAEWARWLPLALLGWGLFAWCGYQIRALQHASYVFERDGLRLTWGLRVVQVPMNRVLWVESADAVRPRLRLPWFWWPGALRGTRRVPGLGMVEFLATSPRGLLLIATPERVFAISPQHPQDCLQALQGLLELGALNPLPAEDAYPAMLWRQLWAEGRVRALFAALALVNLTIVGVTLRTASRGGPVVMNYDAIGRPLMPVPAERALFLPLLNGWFSLALGLIGVWFFRREAQRRLAFVVWSAALLASLVMLEAAWRIR